MNSHVHHFGCPETDHAPVAAPYVGKRRDLSTLGVLVAAARDNDARYGCGVMYVGRRRKAIRGAA